MMTSHRRQLLLNRAEGCRRAQQELEAGRLRRSPLRDPALRPRSPLA